MKTVYVCENCEYSTSKWIGKCPVCGQFSIVETEVEEEKKPSKSKEAKSTGAKVAKLYSGAPTRAQSLRNIEYPKHIRYSTGNGEFDRVLGGGVVEGSVVLLSGEPGIGKSTLLLQICEYVGRSNKILYVSGEESASQIKLRAGRLGVDCADLFVLCETNINRILEETDEFSPKLIIIDSIQTIYDDDVNSMPGTVTQVKQSAMLLINKAKESGLAVIIIGHVNKDGAIAGPKVLEHMVDAVLYFEGDKQHAYRIIRAAKNRFGSTNEIGVFEMTDEGLEEIPNPSEMLLSQRPLGVSGSCAACVIEGSRPIIAEIQALVNPTVFPAPRRMTAGLDYNRVSLLLAVLEKRLGQRFSSLDVYMNVAGGLRLDEPSCDIAAALALLSSLRDAPVPDELIAFGEIGLAGECRAVAGAELRLAEAVRLGFTKVAIPYKAAENLKKRYNGIDLIPIRSVFDLLKILGL